MLDAFQFSEEMSADHQSNEYTALLRSFVCEKVLNDTPKNKKVILIGRFGDRPEPGLLFIERNHIHPHPDVWQASEVTLQQQNDIYTQFIAQLPPQSNDAKIDIIYPATPILIAKYSPQDTHIIRETAALYTAAHLKYIESLDPAALGWVYNAIEKKKEAERLLIEDLDPEIGFVLHPDTKWSLVSSAELYCLAICRKHGIRSLRDLTAEHVPMLKNIRDKSLAYIEQRFKLPSTLVRVYMHYPPSFYHLHIHFVHANSEIASVMSARAHLLDDVIDNLERYPGYYQNAAIAIQVGSEHKLFEPLTKAIQNQNQNQS